MVEQAAHFLSPRHQILSVDERKKFFETTGLRPEQLPKIYDNDLAIKHLKAEDGDVVCVFRKGDADESKLVHNYRLVVK